MFLSLVCSKALCIFPASSSALVEFTYQWLNKGTWFERALLYVGKCLIEIAPGELLLLQENADANCTFRGDRVDELQSVQYSKCLGLGPLCFLLFLFPCSHSSNCRCLPLLSSVCVAVPAAAVKFGGVLAVVMLLLWLAWGLLT